MKSTELMHYGVKGMRWGIRKQPHVVGGSGLVPKKPKGEQPSWRHKKSDRQKRWEDDHGFNPHRPNDTKSRAAIKSKARADRIMEKVGGSKPSNAAMVNMCLSGMRAIQSALEGNPMGTVYYARRSNQYRDAKNYWKKE